MNEFTVSNVERKGGVIVFNLKINYIHLECWLLPGELTAYEYTAIMKINSGGLPREVMETYIKSEQQIIDEVKRQI